MNNIGNKIRFLLIFIGIVTLIMYFTPKAYPQPSIKVKGSKPWPYFEVDNSNEIIFEFTRNPNSPTTIYMYIPSSQVTFTFKKDGNTCPISGAMADCNNNESIIWYFIDIFSLSAQIQILNPYGAEKNGTYRVHASRTDSGLGDWKLLNTSTNVKVESVHAIPHIVDNSPAEATSGQVVVNLDVGSSSAVYEPSNSINKPSITSYNWQAPAPITLSCTNCAKPSFNAPSVSVDTDYDFQVKVSDGELEASEKIRVTVKPPAKSIDCVLLLDTSGSMGWHRTGSANDLAGGCCSRLSSAKSAAKYFANRLGLFSSNSRIGVVIFPGEASPSTKFAKISEPLTSLNTASNCIKIENSIGAESNPSCGNCTSIPPPGLVGTPTGIKINWNGTPTSYGLDMAKNMLINASKAGEKSRIIVLLSDGAWNVGVDPKDPYFLNGFITNDIQIYTVGIGEGTDNVNHASLQNISISTGVGTSGNPTGFATFNVGDPLTVPNLIPFFEKIMADMVVSSYFISDPYGIIGHGETKTHTVPVTSHDSLVSITVSWESSQTDLLDFHVLNPDGQSFYPQISGNGYKNITLDGYSLEAPLGSGEWEIVINYPTYTIGAATSQVEEISYNYSVITQSTLNMKVQLDKEMYFTGDTMYIEAGLVENNKRLKGVTVEAKVSHPLTGIGNWHFENHVSIEQLQEVSDEISSEPLSLLDKKNYVLLQQVNTELPETITEPTITFNDKGIDGDEDSNDGIYTCRFSGFYVPGIYEFLIIASGTTITGEEFHREFQFHKYVDMIPDESKTRIEGSIKERNRDGSGIINIRVTPCDRFGNIFGPGYYPLINIMSSKGEPIGDVEDLLSGEYQQQFKLDNISENPKIYVSIKEVNVFNDLLSKLVGLVYQGYYEPSFGSFINYNYRYPIDYYSSTISSYLNGYAPSVPFQSFVVAPFYDQTWVPGYSFVTSPYQPLFPQVNLPWSIIPFGYLNYPNYSFYQPYPFINSNFNYPQNYYLNLWLSINRL